MLLARSSWIRTRSSVLRQPEPRPAEPGNDETRQPDQNREREPERLPKPLDLGEGCDQYECSRGGPHISRPAEIGPVDGRDLAGRPIRAPASDRSQDDAKAHADEPDAFEDGEQIVPEQALHTATIHYSHVVAESGWYAGIQ